MTLNLVQQWDSSSETKLTRLSEPGSSSVLVAWCGSDRRLCVHRPMEGAPAGTPVELPVSPSCLRFGADSSQLLVGSMNGSLHLIDVITGQSLGGRRPSCPEDRYISALAQDPHNPAVWAVGSGSLASSLRFWDSRAPAAPAPTPLADKRINDLQFSPDGAFLGLASDDCAAYLVDRAAVAVLARFSAHCAPVSANVFYPKECLMATGGGDKTVRVWDLESYECVTQSAPVDGPVVALAFDVVEDGLWVACQGGLRLVGWEPARDFLAIASPSPPVALLVHPASDALFLLAQPGASTLALHSVPLNTLRPLIPYSSESEEPEEVGASFHLHPDIDRTGVAISTPLGMAPSPLFPSAAFESEADAFRPRPKVPRSPPRTPTPEDASPDAEFASSPLHVPPYCSNWSSAISNGSDSLLEPSETGSHEEGPSGGPAPIFITHATPPKPLFTLREEVKPLKAEPKKLRKVAPRTPASEPVRRPPRKTVATVKPQPNSDVKAARMPPPSLLQPTGTFQLSPAPEKDSCGSSSSVASLVASGAGSMSAMLSHRKKAMAAVSATWRSRGVRSAVDQALASRDIALLKDLLHVLNIGRGDAWTLELCVMLLPSIRDLISDESANSGCYIEAGRQSLAVLMRGLGDVIRLGVGRTGIGPDVEGEARTERCRACLRELSAIRSLAARRQSQALPPPQLTALKDIILILSALDA